jgi:hypothetical protein
MALRLLAGFWLLSAGAAWADIPDLAGWTRSYGRDGVTFTVTTAANERISYNLPPRRASLWPFDVSFNREAMRLAGARGHILARSGVMPMGDFSMDMLTVQVKSGRKMRIHILGWETPQGMQLATIVSPVALPESDPQLNDARAHAITLANRRESVEP